jgi:hypothetical protein
MKRGLLFFAALLCVGSFGPRAACQTTQPTVLPRLTLSANNSLFPQAFQGAPLILTGSIYHPGVVSTDTSGTPILINPQNGSWTNTIQLLVTDNAGATQSWPARLVTTATGSLLLDPTNTSTLTWVVSPTATSGITAGTYTVFAVLDTTASAGTTGWKGTSNSHPVSIQVTALPSAPSSNQREQQAELLATYDHLTGNDSQAVADLNTFLTQQPNNIGAMKLKGDILAASGQLTEALDAYDGAVAAFYAANPGPLPERPEGLLSAQRQTESMLSSQSSAHGTPQVGISALGQGTQSAGVSYVDLQIMNIGNDAAQNVLVNQVSVLVTSGGGQALLNTSLSSSLPIFTDILNVNASATVRVFLSTQGTVGNISLTESGTIADVYGAQTPFSQTQSVALNATGGGSPVALTITAQNATQVYGGTTPNLNNVSYSGFVNGDGQGSLSGTLNCVTTANQNSPVGAYPISCSGLSSPNYVITFVSGTLAITPAPLTVTASSATRTFGQTNPAFTGTFAGFVNSDTLSSLSGTLSCTSPATSASSVSGGPYPVNCSGVSSSNYAITFVPGSLTITKATPLITWNSPASITQGTPLSSQQLNATASAPGNFVYTPLVGTVLPAGNAQTLSVAFTPVDAIDYNSASASVTINVLAAPAQVSVPNVVNQTQAAAVAALTGVGLVSGNIATASSNTVAAGSVVSETPAAGTQVAVGASVNLVISTGPPVVPKVVSFNVLFGNQAYNVTRSSRIRLPWQITGIQVIFSEPIAAGSSASLSGAGVTGFGGLGTNTLTWTITPISIGNVAFQLSGSGTNALKDAAGNALNAGAGIRQALKILLGDFNDDGAVSASDMVGVNNAISAPYNVFGDMNGDGVVSSADVQVVRARAGTTLP